MKARAIQETLKFSAKKSMQNMVIESDSLTLKNIIQQTWRVL